MGWCKQVNNSTETGDVGKTPPVSVPRRTPQILKKSAALYRPSDPRLHPLCQLEGDQKSSG